MKLDNGEFYWDLLSFVEMIILIKTWQITGISQEGLQLGCNLLNIYWKEEYFVQILYREIKHESHVNTRFP
jgi:hypothetical protein